MTTTGQQTDGRDPRLRLGIALMLAGLALMAYRLDLWDLDLSRHFWPLVPLAIGLAQVIVPPADKAGRRSRRGGMWLIYVGLWGLISEYRLFGLDYGSSWPLLIIAAGLNIVWRSLESPRTRNAQEN
jgi:hypothetical protein